MCKPVMLCCSRLTVLQVCIEERPTFFCLFPASMLPFLLGTLKATFPTFPQEIWQFTITVSHSEVMGRVLVQREQLLCPVNESGSYILPLLTDVITQGNPLHCTLFTFTSLHCVHLVRIINGLILKTWHSREIQPWPEKYMSWQMMTNVSSSDELLTGLRLLTSAVLVEWWNNILDCAKILLLMSPFPVTPPTPLPAAQLAASLHRGFLDIFVIP